MRNVVWTGRILILLITLLSGEMIHQILILKGVIHHWGILLSKYCCSSACGGCIIIDHCGDFCRCQEKIPDDILGAFTFWLSCYAFRGCSLFEQCWLMTTYLFLPCSSASSITYGPIADGNFHSASFDEPKYVTLFFFDDHLLFRSSILEFRACLTHFPRFCQTGTLPLCAIIIHKIASLILLIWRIRGKAWPHLGRSLFFP